MLNWQHKGGLDTRVLTKVDYTNISDPYYFQDLKSYQEGIKTQDYVNQQGSVTYRGDTYQAALNLQAYQLATISQITPYNRLPQLTFNGTLPYHPGGLNFAYETEAVRFDRDLESGTFKDENGDTSARLDTLVAGLTRANGTRLTAAPNVSLPLEWSYGFLTPKLKYVYTKYDLDLDSQGKDDLVWVLLLWAKHSRALKAAQFRLQASTAVFISTATRTGLENPTARHSNRVFFISMFPKKTKPIFQSLTLRKQRSATRRCFATTALSVETVSVMKTSCRWV
jgi:LPS-assembly protein